jgi:Tfp pilus assembly protein PilO
MTGKSQASLLLPVFLMIINVLIFLPISWIANQSLDRINALEKEQDRIRTSYLTDSEYKTDQEDLNDMLNKMDSRIYELSR